LKQKLKHENNLLKSQLQVQEQTFQNISREVHDNIGQKLTLAKLWLNTLDISDYNIKKSVNDVVQIITESLTDLRDISRSLSSEIIINNGLIIALENEINQLNKTCKYNIKLTITGEVFFMDVEKELVIFRMIQESLSNIMKHAEATKVDIALFFSENNLIIEVLDNGKGFDVSASKNGNGLNNIRNRAQFLGGFVLFESEKNKGANVKIEIPDLNKKVNSTL
jgi:signal transduction histidine kinase